MLKKIIASAVLCAGAALYAYNPPAGGQNLLRISSPELLSEGASAAGGALYSVSPDSVVNNPALTAFEQRAVLNLSGTMLFDSKDESDKSVGGAFEGGILLPSRWCVSSFLVQGVFVPFYDMHLGNSFNFTANVAKDVTDKLSVGVSAELGIFYGHNSDWRGGVNLGAFYDFGEAGFFKDIRFGAVLLNIGKQLGNTTVLGITGSEASEWPGIATPKIGAAATFFEQNNFKAGASLDFSFPSFQNFVCDAGLQLLFADVIKVSSSWEYDAREFSEGSKNILPSVGVSFQFKFNSKNGSLLAKKGWEQSEMTVSGAWKQLYKNVNAVSAGAKINLGLKDTQAPEIILWGEK